MVVLEVALADELDVKVTLAVLFALEVKLAALVTFLEN